MALIGAAPLMDRFWSKVHKTDGCWLWTGWSDKDGYGMFRLGGKDVRATHAALQIIDGSDVPSGMIVMHSCDTPNCVNPDHLMIGSHADNMLDKVNKGRANGAHPGEQHHYAKLTEKAVREIMSLRETISARQLAPRYGISVTTVNRIWNGDTWRHITQL